MTEEVDIAFVEQYTDRRDWYCPLGNLLTVEVDIASGGQYTDSRDGYCLFVTDNKCGLLYVW